MGKFMSTIILGCRSMILVDVHCGETTNSEKTLQKHFRRVQPDVHVDEIFLQPDSA
jgi:hypothetical protein